MEEVTIVASVKVNPNDKMEIEGAYFENANSQPVYIAVAGVKVERTAV